MGRQRYFVNNLPDYEEINDAVAVLDQDRGIIGEKVVYWLNSVTEHTTQREVLWDVYVGLAGIGYCLLRAHTQAATRHLCLDVDHGLEAAANLVAQAAHHEARSHQKHSKSSPALLCGAAGLCVVQALLSATQGKAAECHSHIRRYISLGKQAAATDFAVDEYLYGRSGYLFGGMLLNRQLGRPVVPLELLKSVAEALIISGLDYSARHKHRSPLMYAFPPSHPTEYIGMAHGLMGIVHTLLLCTEHWFSTPAWRTAVIGTLNYLLVLEAPGEAGSGHYPTSTANDKSLVHWCHGSTGAVFCFAEAHAVLGESAYLEAAIRAGEVVWREGLLKKGPGLCHGVAGNGYALLRLHRATEDQKWLHRAHMFARRLCDDVYMAHCNTPDRPYSLYEGWAGATLFLADMLDPVYATFPFAELPGQW